MRELLVPLPTRSVVVFDGQRAAAAALTKRPLAALRLTLLPTVFTSSRDWFSPESLARTASSTHVQWTLQLSVGVPAKGLFRTRFSRTWS
ncbi:hypothetical protein GCM10009706_29770 [Curtobacterium citreum]|nr:hypothetical protein GCM10009706_29770 [Curtobacterium citreum]